MIDKQKVAHDALLDSAALGTWNKAAAKSAPGGQVDALD